VGVYLFDEHRFIYVNQALAELFGYTPGELMGRLGPLDLTHPQDRKAVEEDIRRRLSGGEGGGARHQFRGLHKDGSVVWCEAISQVIRYRGRPMIVGTLVDFTARKSMEEELEAKERYYRALFEGANDAIFIMEGERFVGCNEKTLEIFGCHSKGEILGRSPFDFSPPFQPGGTPSEEKGRGLIEAALRGAPQRFYWKHLRKNGEPFDAEVSLNRVDVGGKVYLQAIVRDITLRKRMEEALRRNKELYQDLVERSGLAIFVVGKGGRMEYFNQQLCELLGYTSQEMKGLSFIDGVHPEDRDLVLDFFERWFSGDPTAPARYECRLVRKSGEVRQVEVDVTPVAGDGGVTAFRVYLRDVTEKKDMEKALYNARKMEAMGRLAGGVAHDFNNMLMVIMGNCDLILQGLVGPEDLYRKVGAIKDAANRAADLTQQLLAFSKKQILEPRVLRLNDVVADMESMLRRLIGEDVELRVRLDPHLWLVKADPSQMEQVIVNLAVNARDAMPQGGCLTIETANVELEEGHAGVGLEMAPGPYVKLTVEDTGLGMDEETRERAFEPFFTTKERGTGLGLATVYGIVKQSGGHIWCHTEPGKGTTFEIYLPRVEDGEERIEERDRESHTWEGGTETVLVAEDDPSVREVTVSILKSAGYRVLEAASGPEALDVCRRHPGLVDVLVTDVVMPGMSGRALATRMEAMYPGMKVLYISGYTDNIIARHGVLEDGLNFIQKPFTRIELLRKVRQVLDG